MIEAELAQRAGQVTEAQPSQARRRARAALQSPEGQSSGRPSGTSAEDGRGVTASATIGTMTLQEATRADAGEIGVQADLGFTYLPPAEPTRVLRIETGRILCPIMVAMCICTRTAGDFETPQFA